MFGDVETTVGGKASQDGLLITIIMSSGKADQWD